MNYYPTRNKSKEEVVSEFNTPLSKCCIIELVPSPLTEFCIQSCDVGTLCDGGGTAASAHPGTHKPDAGDCQHEVAGARQKAG